MSRLYQPPIPITMEMDEAGSPRLFFWQERMHQVKWVEQHWEIDTLWWTATGRATRAYFVLTTQAGLICEVYYAPRAGEWFLIIAYD